MQLYHKIRKVKLFDAYRYLYHAEMNEYVLRAALEMKRTTSEQLKGGRIGWDITGRHV